MKIIMSNSAVVKETKREIDILSGSVWDKILMFTIPIAASSILQQLFNAADVAVVGKFASDSALAAVGSTSSLINLIINLFVGLSVGANVIISRFIGQEDAKNASLAAHSSVALAIVCGLIMTVLGQLIAVPALEIMSCPSEVIGLATLYMRIYFLGMPFMMLYNFCYAILRSRGDTKRPLYGLTASGIINVILNLFFVIVCRLSVAGVAIATVISNIVSSGLLIYFLINDESAVRINPKKIRLDKRLTVAILKIGVPTGLQTSMFSISNVCVQSAINKLGKAYIAASAAETSIDSFIYFIPASFGQTCVTFISQNHAARNYKRCKSIIRQSLVMGVLITAVASAVALVFGRQLLGIFTDSELIIKYGMEKLWCIMPLELVMVFSEVLSGALRSAGYSVLPACISVAGVCVLRIVWMYTFFAAHRSFINLMIVYPISWVATSAAILVAYLALRRRIFPPTEQK